MPPKTKKFNHKVIFADFAAVKFQAVMQMLATESVQAECHTDVQKLLARLSEETFDILVINLLVAGIGPFELFEGIRKSSLNPNLKVIVVTRQVNKLNIQNVMEAGADDFIAEPFENSHLVNRIIYHLGSVTVIETSGFSRANIGLQSSDYVNLMVEAAELLARTDRENLHSTIFQILNDVAGLLKSNRTSLIIVDEPSNTGVVLATSDDAAFYNYPVNLDRYPEILHVMHTGSLVVVEDVGQSTLTEAIQKNVKSISIGSLMAFPVTYQGDIVGVLLIRRQDATEIPEKETLRLLQAIANLMAAHSNVAVLLRRIYKGYKTTKAA